MNFFTKLQNSTEFKEEATFMKYCDDNNLKSVFDAYVYFTQDDALEHFKKKLMRHFSFFCRLS